MLTLAPTLRPKLATLAARRFPEDSWIWRIDSGEVRGIHVLRAHTGTPFFLASCERAARMGLLEALAECVQEVNFDQVLRVVWLSSGQASTVQLAQKALQHHPPQQVLAILAALLGPSMERGIRVLWPMLQGRLSAGEIEELKLVFELE